MLVLRCSLFVVVASWIAGPAEAHHEAIIGPQSSAVLSAESRQD